MVKQYETNVFGVVNVPRAFMPHFRKNKDGFVVFIGSVGGWIGSAAGGPYCSSKSTLEGPSLSHFAPTEQLIKHRHIRVLPTGNSTPGYQIHDC